MKPCLKVLFALSFLLSAFTAGLRAADVPVTTNYVAGQLQELNDNGAWSWFMDPRVIMDHDRLIVGSVRAVGNFHSSHSPGWGNVELSVLDLKTSAVSNLVLHAGFEQDDHNAPGLLVLRDGRYLAAYSKHAQETKMY